MIKKHCRSQQASLIRPNFDSILIKIYLHENKNDTIETKLSNGKQETKVIV